MLTYGSVCSGVEAASLAWEPLGLKPAWFAEIDPFPAAVLAHHWPNVPNHGDMTKLEEKILAGEAEAPDILVGGTPCQAFSIAGLRNSLSDERGNLTLILVRILNAIDFVRRKQGKKPCILVWENVPGVLSTKDNAFGNFTAALSGEDVAFQPAGKRWTGAGFMHGGCRKIAYRILDAQYFGVPQRRRRIFLLAGAGGISPAEILFERESGGGSFKQGGETQQESACYPESSFGTYRKDRVCGTVKASGGTCQGGSETLIVHGRQDPCSSNKAYALDCQAAGNTNVFLDGAGAKDLVRRLTPVECERLQGVPDNHTHIPWKGKPAEQCPDGLRYKAIGNSMAVPVMRWIGRRLLGHLDEAGFLADTVI